MPQARRKTPFSGKAKKQQLQNKKQNKVMLMPTSSSSAAYEAVSLNYQPNRGRGDTNRYALKFYRESEEELVEKKEYALKALNPVPEEEMEADPQKYFPEELSFPKRPPWDFTMTPAQLDAQEQRYFKNYIDKLQASEHWKEMSYFELNLETWRQLWRVMEMCDILLLIVDVRYAGMMFPPSLYEYIVKDQRKDMILVLNKIDLVPASVVAAWKEHFTTVYPGLKVVYFTCCPGYNLRGATSDKAGLQVRRRKGRQRMCVEGATQLLDACKDLVKGEVDLASWENKIKEEMGEEREDDEIEVGETIIEKPDTSFYTHEKYKNGVLTIGCCGQPNVGKSSLMNAVLGKKRLSVSKTPGHTKHFQTIYTTPQVNLANPTYVGKSSLMNAVLGKKRLSVSKTPGHTKHFQTIYTTPQVRFCDCPGLVFPSKVPRPIQILMGSYPIAQLREPYTAIRYIAERIDLPKLLRIEHPERDDTWSPRDICDGWAKKRGYLTAKAARLDTYRAANSLLRMALDGKVCLWLRPPGFTAQKDKFENTEEVKYVMWVQARSKEDGQDVLSDIGSDENDEIQANTQSDSEEEDEESDDAEQTAAMANKFAALAGDD